MNNEVLRTFHISKTIRGKAVLEDISFFANEGEFTAILGLERTGKSCLFDILRGEQEKDSGQLFLMGRPYLCTSASKAREQGVFFMESRPKVIEYMTVGMYLFMFNTNRRGRIGISERKVYAQAVVILEKYGLPISPYEKLGSLSLQEWRLLELILIEMQSPKVVLLENVPLYEMMSVDTRMKNCVTRMAEKGTAFICFESSVSENIIRLCKRVYLLKNGYLSAELLAQEMDESSLRVLLTGVQASEGNVAVNEKEYGAELLRSDNKSGAKGDEEIILHEGEVLGAVLDEVCSDDSEFVFDFLYGKDRKGQVFKQGEQLKKASLAVFQKKGVVIVPDPFITPGVFSGLGLKANLMEKRPGIPYKGPKSLSKREETFIAERILETLDFPVLNSDAAIPLRAINSDEIVKIWIGRWLWRNPEVFIFVNPFSIMDEKGCQEMKRIFTMLCAHGKGILVLATTYKKMYDICDKVIESPRKYIS